MFRINALFYNHSIGNIFLDNVLTATLKNQFEKAQLNVLYHNRSGFKPLISQLNPYIDKEIIKKGINFFNLDILYDRKIIEDCDFFYTTAALRQNVCPEYTGIDWCIMAGFKNKAYLSFPKEIEKIYHNKLVEKGINPDKWYTVIHAREKGFRGPLGRDTNPHTYYELAKYIINELGGQVVRLGDSSMTNFPQLKGLIDFRFEDDFLLHCYAIYRSRFIVVSDSAWHPAGSAFNVPTAVTNLFSCAFPWNEHDMILTKKLITTDGKKLFQQDFATDSKAVMSYIYAKKDCVIKDNSVKELCSIAEKMHEQTSNTVQWREHKHIKPVNYPEKIEIPFERKINAKFLDV